MFKREGAKDIEDGIYAIPHPNTERYRYWVALSTGEGWEHLSVTLREIVTQQGKRVLKAVQRCPTWGEMCFLKDMFWDPTECVVQFHPPMVNYVSMAEFCLHLWKPTAQEFPAPPSVLVGLNNEDLNEVIAHLESIFPGPTREEYLKAIYHVDIRLFKSDIQKYDKHIAETLMFNAQE